MEESALFFVRVQAPVVYVKLVNGLEPKVFVALEQAYYEAVQDQLLPYATRWGVVVDLTDFVGYPPAALFSAWKDVLDWSSQHGQVAAAVVGQPESFAISLEIEKAREGPVVRQYFTDFQAAQAWIWDFLGANSSTAA